MMRVLRFTWSVLVLSQLWSGLNRPAGAAAAGEGFGTLNATIIDAATGLPTPCTVILVDAHGKTVIERESFRAGFRSDGRFTKRLPAGSTRLRVTRGFETRAVERVLDLPANGKLDVEISLERVVDLRRRGWYSGDSHAHMIHGERTIPVDFDFVALTAQAEDLQYLSLSHAWALENPTPERLEAELGARSKPHCVLTWNMEAPKNYYQGDAGRCLGHCWMLGVRGRTAAGEDVIRSLLEASAGDYQSDKPTYANFESHRLIHAQGGAVFYTHPARWWMGPWGGQGGYPKQERMRVSNMAVELPLDTLVGPTYDGLDLITTAGEFQANAVAFELWALLLNHGYRLAGTASSDACFDRPGGGIPGIVRTYTYLGENFSVPAVARATALGRTFVSSGPLLLVSLDGRPPGSAFPADGQARQLQIEAWPSGADPEGLTGLEILRNGKPIRTNQFSPAISALQTNLPIAETESAWYCVRVFGSDPPRQRAISGAFFLERADARRPGPVPARVRVELLDVATGEKISGAVTEVACYGNRPQDGRKHRIVAGEETLIIPATLRLRAEAAGYEPMTKSPFLDHPALVELITRFSADDLLKWEAYERIQALLDDVPLTFRMKKSTR